MKPGWEPYDPTWLAVLAAAERPDIVGAVLQCTSVIRESIAYYRFLSPVDGEGRRRIRESIPFDDPDRGEVVVDVISDGRVSGVEFLRHVADVP